jgi:hypothetical protein
LTTLAAEAAETMWDAVLASIPENGIFTPPAKSPPVSRAETLAAYAGTYEFGEASVAYGGLGLDIAIEDGGVKVSPREGEPAARAGVMVGDVVTRVDGAPLQGVALGLVIDRLRGPAGSSAELTIVRKGEAGSMTIAVTREPIRPRALLQVRAEGGQLIVEAVGGRQVYEFQRAKSLPVIPLSETEFYVDGRYHTRLAFTRDAAGKVSGAVLNPGRWEKREAG